MARDKAPVLAISPDDLALLEALKSSGLRARDIHALSAGAAAEREVNSLAAKIDPSQPIPEDLESLTTAYNALGDLRTRFYLSEMSPLLSAFEAYEHKVKKAFAQTYIANKLAAWQQAGATLESRASAQEENAHVTVSSETGRPSNEHTQELIKNLLEGAIFTDKDGSDQDITQRRYSEPELYHETFGEFAADIHEAAQTVIDHRLISYVSEKQREQLRQFVAYADLISKTRETDEEEKYKKIYQLIAAETQEQVDLLKKITFSKEIADIDARIIGSVSSAASQLDLQAAASALAILAGEESGYGGALGPDVQKGKWFSGKGPIAKAQVSLRLLLCEKLGKVSSMAYGQAATVIAERITVEQLKARIVTLRRAMDKFDQLAKASNLRAKIEILPVYNEAASQPNKLAEPREVRPEDFARNKVLAAALSRHIATAGL